MKPQRYTARLANSEEDTVVSFTGTRRAFLAYLRQQRATWHYPLVKEITTRRRVPK